jgi:hypothetical protein
MLEMIIGSISSFSNIHEVVDDNSNCYRSMVMDTIKMNHSYWSKDSCVDEELNINTSRFFKFLKDFNEWLRNGCINCN